MSVDLIITNATLVTVNARREVLRDAELTVQGSRIVKVGPKHKGPRAGLSRVIDARGGVVLPGFVHGHLHACQTLFRNRADGLELLDWLRERIWPFEAAHDAASMRASADLTFLELIRGGSTAALDMGSVHHYGAVFEAARDSGFRLTGGKAMMDAGQGVPAGLRESTQGSLEASLALAESWHGTHDGRLRYAFAPRFALSCSEALLRQVGVLAREKGLRIHSHASENPTECDLVREKTGEDNVAWFSTLGLLGPHTTLAHCVWLTANEFRLLRETRTHVCHCPSSNLKLASGIAKVPELLEAGVPLSLGADGAACNNNLDMWMEMRLAALIHKPRTGPLSMAAHDVLELATLGGARALGLEAEVGSLEPGKRADFSIVSLEAPHLNPQGDDVVSALVYAGQARDVRDVFIDGQQVLRDGETTTLEYTAVIEAARRHARRIAESVG